MSSGDSDADTEREFRAAALFGATRSVSIVHGKAVAGSLQEKVQNLKLEAALAIKHAQGWQGLIDKYGEDKTTEFYTHLGLNHLEKKSFEWEGLTLSREPKEHEKIAVKGIANAQESSKEAIGKILLSLREELISDGLKGIKKLKPASYHELTLQASSAIRTSLRDRLIKVYKQGRMLVVRELGTLPKGFAHEPGCNERFIKNDPPGYQCKCEFKAAAEDEFDDLDDLTDLTDSRIANDVQSRITAAATRFSLLGLTGSELETAIQNEITAGSVSYIDRAATGLANKVINIGRSDEAESRTDEWERVEYSALLDQNVCDPCASFDGDSSTDEADLEPAPSPSCLGGDWCRCFHVFVAI